MTGDGTRAVRAGLPDPVPGQPFLPGPVFAAPYHLDPTVGPQAGLDAYGRTDKGRIRPTNEDCFAIEPSLGLFVVADGMGGHNAGEVAARLAVAAVVDFVRLRSVDPDASVRLRSLETAASFVGIRFARPGAGC